MFILSVLKDKIPIHPSQFGLPPEQALINELNKKYANRVLHDVGLCICVFDVAEVGEGKVRYGDGFLWYTGERTFILLCSTLLIQYHSRL
jgi:DNA-directed RNA polymerase III subunit RPC8